MIANVSTVGTGRSDQAVRGADLPGDAVRSVAPGDRAGAAVPVRRNHHVISVVVENSDATAADVIATGRADQAVRCGNGAGHAAAAAVPRHRAGSIAPVGTSHQIVTET